MLLTKEVIIEWLQDLYGYSYDDAEFIYEDGLTDEQADDIFEYINNFYL